MTRLSSAQTALTEDTFESFASQRISPSNSSPTTFHVAIIMDGNGRWANQRGLPRTMGHYYGAESARKVIETAGQAGITHLTLFGFSTENWQRPRTETDYLMSLLRGYLSKDIAQLHKNGVRLVVIGDRPGLPADIVALIEKAEALTNDNSGLNLTIALNYGGRADIVAGVRQLAREIAAGRMTPDAIDEAALAHRLPSAFLPDPDLLIRTSGEQRISNFLLWQIAYAEMLFVDRLWPDFTGADLLAAIGEYRQRNRRFGGL
jgi:undecaprenyl diphosphate synthase